MRGVTYIMACFNAGPYLRPAVNSVLAQKHGHLPFELRIVNDGSTDSYTRAVLRNIAEQDHPNVLIHDLPCNIGQSAARNVALREATYDFIIPVDSDDLLNTDPRVIAKGSYASRAVEILDVNPEVMSVCAPPQCFGAYNYRPCPRSYREKRQLTHGIIHVYGAYRKDEALAIGGYDENLPYMDDYFFFMDMIGQRVRDGLERKVVQFNEPYYLYRQHTHGMNVNRRERDWDMVTQRSFARNPELCRLHFPGCSDEEILEELRKIQRSPGNSLSEKLYNAATHPIWAVDRLATKFRERLHPAPSTENGLDGFEPVLK